MTSSDFAEITKSTPEESLVASKRKHAGRNAQGKITIRHGGGGARGKYRIIDFKRNSKNNIPTKVVTIKYDPNRTASIALLCYADGAKAYILAPRGLAVSQTVMGGDKARAGVSNCLPLVLTPVGSEIHNIKLCPDKGAQLIRAAGVTAQLMAKEGRCATLRPPSNEMRMMPINCRAAMGNVRNDEHNLISLDKAGRKRHIDVRPTIHGSVISPDDHSHGGSEGRAPIGRPGPCTPWGKPAMGLKTRKKNKQSSKLIVERRNGKA